MTDDKIKAFEAKLIEERDKLQKSFKLAMITYIILALVVLIYTTFAYSAFYSLIGPEGMKEQGTMIVNTAADYPDKLLLEYEANRDEWAKAVTDKALAAIPEVEKVITTQLDAYNADIKEALRKEIMPGFNEYLTGTTPALKVRLAELKKTRPDATIGMVLTNVFVEYLDQETAKLLREDEVIAKAEDLQRDLHSLQKADGKLTKKQLAERKLLVNFILISKLDVDGSPLLDELHKFLEKRFGVTAKQVQEDKVLEDIPDPTDQEPL